MKKKIIFCVAFSAILFACGVSKNTSKDTVSSENTNNNTPENFNDSVEEIATRERYHGSETKYFDLIHTKLAVKFDWKKSYLYGTEWLSVKPHFYTQDSLVLDAKSMDIQSVKMNGNSLKFKYDTSLLTIYLNRPYTKNETLMVQIDYTAKPNEKKAGGSAAIMEDKGLYFINPTGEDKNKMPQIWTQGETEGNSVWFPTIDAPNQKMTQEIAMTVDNKYLTLSNGLLVKSINNADGTRTDFWETKLPFAPYLTMMAVGEFKIVKDTYTKADGTKIEVNYYVEPQWEKYARDIFGQTPEMIAYFSKLLGVEYPWAKFSQIIVRDYVSGAMENVGAVVFGDFTYKTKRELIDDNDRSTIAHELFHHWFGDLVTTESWSNLPLNESFANYSQYLWDEYKEGIDEAEYNAGIEAQGYYQTAQYQGIHNLIWYDYLSQEQMFDGHSYNKGGRVLNMLRNVVGDSAFFAALHLYLTENKFGTAEIDNLRLAFEQITGEDLHWFFNQWFFGKGHPILTVNKTVSAGKVEVTIQQDQDLTEVPLYRLPMKISVFDNASRHDYQVVLDKEKQVFTFPLKDTLSALIVDADHVLLSKWNKDVSPNEAIFLFYHGGKYMDREEGLELGVRAGTEASKKLIFDALNDPFYVIRKNAISKATRVKRSHTEQLIGKLKEMVAKDPVSSVRGSALQFLLDNFKSEPSIKELCQHVLNNDSSYLVIGKALFGIAAYDSAAALATAKSLESEPSQALLSNISMLYGKYNAADNFSFYQNTINTKEISGMNAIGFLSGFTSFVKNNDLSIQTKALEVYKVAAEKGGMYAKLVMSNFIDALTEMLQSNVTKMEASDKVANKTRIEQTKALIDQYNAFLDDLSGGFKSKVKVITSED
jgi:aminopeptidase N